MSDDAVLTEEQVKAIAEWGETVDSAYQTKGRSETIIAVIRSHERLRAQQYSGEWQCDTCGFVTNRDSQLICPNDGVPLRRVTWEAAAKEARKLFLQLSAQLATARKDERERCARVCELSGHDYLSEKIRMAANDIASAIRALGDE